MDFTLTPDQIQEVGQRVFGIPVDIDFAQRFALGTFNDTLLVQFFNQPKVVFRVAPADQTKFFWKQKQLMRREHHIQPYFANIADLMPTVLLVDFSHQFIDQDYMVQSYVEGDCWEEVYDDLTTAQQNQLWPQFGTILKKIHATTGDRFGWPYPEKQFSTWAETVYYWLDQMLLAFKTENLDTTALMRLKTLTQANQAVLDQITQPRLLHGDLWPFNLLIDRSSPEVARIVGVLDADHAWWGDPMADWTMFIWSNGSGVNMPLEHGAFWDGYGWPEATDTSRYRAQIYAGMHLASLAAEFAKLGQPDQVQRAQRDLNTVVDAL
ncbi:MAG: phosphotransferase [Chloroflexota bacterium]